MKYWIDVNVKYILTEEGKYIFDIDLDDENLTDKILEAVKQRLPKMISNPNIFNLEKIVATPEVNAVYFDLDGSPDYSNPLCLGIEKPKPCYEIEIVE